MKYSDYDMDLGSFHFFLVQIFEKAIIGSAKYDDQFR
jgi:hypothetical protein